jgi:hypothetical protein
VSCDAEVGRWCSEKLYYLNVTFLNINKAFPYKKKLCRRSKGSGHGWWKGKKTFEWEYQTLSDLRVVFAAITPKYA